jgi:hypothetical protein
MEYKVYELVDGGYVLKKTFKDNELAKAKELLATLEVGQIEKVTALGSEILSVD